MKKKPNKQKFIVGEQETISDCLDRMAREGYEVKRRMERPIFQEVIKNGKVEMVPLRQEIVFEGVLKKND